MSTVEARSTLALPQRAHWSPKQFAEHCGVRRRTVWAWVARKLVPQPCRFSRNCVRWSAAEMAAFLPQL
jgi:predicted DNA-binding transcriptional regulator AlpA